MSSHGVDDTMNKSYHMSMIDNWLTRGGSCHMEQVTSHDHDT